MAILGGGLAGLTIALEIKKARPSTKILVIEKKSYPVSEATHKVGESTVEIAAHYMRDIIGLEDHLQMFQLRKYGLRMFFSASNNHNISQRAELGSTVFPPLCTYQLDRGRLENELSRRLAEHGITLLHGGNVKQITLQPQHTHHCLHILHDDRDNTIDARWIIDASGRTALLKRQLGLSKKVGHHANAVWFRIAQPVDINSWSDDPDWHLRQGQGDRSLSTNHLMGAGYWVWLIRLASGSTSVGIVTDAHMHSFSHMNRFEQALDWLHTHEPQCAEWVEQHRSKVQDFRVMKDYAYSCQQVYSNERWCLTGEAGVSLDPLYSPGSDLIAISNGLVCDLVTRSLNGEDIRGRALVHDKLFLNVTDIWLSIYEQQYSLMDNAHIMVTKIIWDTAFYWGVFGLLYFHHSFQHIADRPSIAANLSRIAILSNRVQAFFRQWHAIDDPSASKFFVDLYAPLDFMVKLHTGMAAHLSVVELEQQFEENVGLFERLAGQIISIVIDAFVDTSLLEAPGQQVRCWQSEAFITELLERYHQERSEHPIENSWIALKYPRPAYSSVAS
ncbi:MAG: halogenase [Blastochloris sp.]|nr:halogenase [Blastochloris sp.]